MKTRTSDDTEISIERARPDMPGKYATGFTRGNSTSIEHLTQGELIDLWQRIGTLFSLTAAASPQNRELPAPHPRPALRRGRPPALGDR